MGVVPPYDHFRSKLTHKAPLGVPRIVKQLNVPPCLLQHFNHVCLKDMIHGFDCDSGSRLRHGKDIHNVGSPFIDVLAKHETHDFHRYTSPAVFQHLNSPPCSEIHKDLTTMNHRNRYLEECKGGY